MMGSGAYTFRAFALQSASFWIHVHASVLALLRRPGSFKVTPKRGADGRQPRAMLPALAAAACWPASRCWDSSATTTRAR